MYVDWRQFAPEVRQTYSCRHWTTTKGNLPFYDVHKKNIFLPFYLNFRNTPSAFNSRKILKYHDKLSNVIRFSNPNRPYGVVAYVCKKISGVLLSSGSVHQILDMRGQTREWRGISSSCNIMWSFRVTCSLRSMAVLSSRAQERLPRAFSALARLYYLVRPTKTAMLRRLRHLWNPDPSNLRCGIRTPGALESGIQLKECRIHCVEFRIQDCLGFPYTGRTLVSENICFKQTK